ncbi:B12 binding domain containing protein, partial [Striga asiatica]
FQACVNASFSAASLSRVVAVGESRRASLLSVSKESAIGNISTRLGLAKQAKSSVHSFALRSRRRVEIDFGKALVPKVCVDGVWHSVEARSYTEVLPAGCWSDASRAGSRFRKMKVNCIFFMTSLRGLTPTPLFTHTQLVNKARNYA